MGVSVRWFNGEQHAMLYTFTGNWTVEELLGVEEAVLEMQGNHPTPHDINVVVDMRNSGDVPGAFIRRVRQFNGMHTHNDGYIIVVGIGRAEQYLFNLINPFLSNLMPKIRLVETLSEADQILQTKQTS